MPLIAGPTVQGRRARRFLFRHGRWNRFVNLVGIWFTAMNRLRPHYSLIQEPTNTWMVWDNWHDYPACLDSRPLVGMSRDRAEATLLMLARIASCPTPEDNPLLPWQAKRTPPK